MGGVKSFAYLNRCQFWECFSWLQHTMCLTYLIHPYLREIEAPLDLIQELALEDPPAPKVRSKKDKFFFKKVKEAMDDIAEEEEMADAEK